MGSFNSGMSTLNASMPDLSAGVTTLTKSLNTLATSSSALSTGTDSLAQAAAQVASGAATVANGTSTLANGSSQLASGMGTLASGANSVASGANTLASKTGQLASGANTLASGAGQVATGTKKLNNGSGSLDSGATQVNTGVQALNTKLKTMTSQLSQLSSGLDDADAGLAAIETGSTSMRSYLLELQHSYLGKQFYMPSESIHAKAFKPALDAYMADGEKITDLTLVFKGDPNSQQVNQQFKTLQRDLSAKLKHGALRGTTVAIGGQTSQDNDLRTLADGDFQRTATIMLIGICIALIVVTQSLLQPLTIIGTLVASFFASMGLTRLVSAKLLGDSLLSWNTPFFTFIMLMALGVDYSIFLMIRFKDDLAEPDIRQRMLKAATTIGAVVISAAIILGGTFAALIPSGVTTLIQVALGVIFGLVILVILLPIAMSGLISLNEWHETREHKQD